MKDFEGNRKRWILFSTLTLAGGLILTTNSTTTIKADNIPANAGTTETETGNADTTPTTNTTTPANDPTNDNQVNYTINYVDSTSSNVLKSTTGTADGGSSITIPTATIAGYQQNASSQYQLASVTTDADKKQDISVPMTKLTGATLFVKENESDGNSINRIPVGSLEVNDSNYKNDVQTELSTMQKGRKVDFSNSSYGYSYLNTLDYLKGMENSSPADIVIKVLENEGSSDVLNESLSGKDLDFGFQYLPIDENYEVHYVAVGGPQDGKVIYIDKGQRDNGVLPSTPHHRGIPASDAVPGYKVAGVNSIDENDISFDEESGVLTFKVPVEPGILITINEYDKNKKLVKTVNWDILSNDKIAIQPDSVSDPLFPSGKIRYADVSGVLNDSFYKDLIMDKNLIIDDSSFDDIHGDSPEVSDSAAQVMGLYNQLYGLDTTNHNMGYITKFIMNALFPNGSVGENWSGNVITINAYLDFVDQSTSTSIPVAPSDVVSKVNNIATTTKKVNLYDNKGNLITNRALDINTSWQSDQEFTYNGQKYYRVSPDEYVKAGDVYLYKDTDTSLVRIFSDGNGSIVDYLGSEVSRKLDPATDWKTDRIALINGNEYYRVSTNEFIKVDTVQPYEDDFENLVTPNLTNTYDEHGKELTLKLPNNTGYKTDRIVTINDIKYYRVSTDTFVKVDDIQKTTK